MNYALSYQQLSVIRELRCRITAILIQPTVGAAVVKDGGLTMAVIHQNGRIGYGYVFQDGSRVHASLDAIGEMNYTIRPDSDQDSWSVYRNGIRFASYFESREAAQAFIAER